MFTKAEDTPKEINLTIATASDLSECSYETMREIIEEKYAEIRGSTFNHLFSPKGAGVVTLKVSLWDAETAMKIMGKYRNCNVLISRDYRADEHSVSVDLYSTIINVYSPGA